MLFSFFLLMNIKREVILKTVKTQQVSVNKPIIKSCVREMYANVSKDMKKVVKALCFRTNGLFFGNKKSLIVCCGTILYS